MEALWINLALNTNCDVHTMVQISFEVGEGRRRIQREDLGRTETEERDIT
jgi:hypothetical protein